MPESVLEVINVSKKFRMHHEKRDSIYESIGGNKLKDCHENSKYN